MDQQIQSKQIQPKPVQSKPKSKKKIITVVVFLIILIAVGYLIGTEVNDWWQVRKEYVKMGFASDKFPFRMYTERELVERGTFPEDLYSNIPTRTRPEQTYAKFRQALVDGDLDKAVECFSEEKRKTVRTGLSNVLNNAELKNQMLEDLPEKIENVSITGSLTYYDYPIMQQGKKMAHTITFAKDKDGDWKIESL